MNSLSATIPKRVFPFKHFQKVICAYSTTKTEAKEEIVIPKRIPRGPTDILRALEGTIKPDGTAAHFKYHDDPYLIPMSNLGKRTFAMSQEAGRKAAHWIRQEHADLFQHREAEPFIEAFAPKTIYNENAEVTEDDLFKVIKNGLVTDAVAIYKLLKDKGVSISQGGQQELLELLCYYNHEEPVSEEFIEERWFRQSSRGKERLRKTWRDGMLAEEIFIGIDKPGAEAYSALIQGMAKYGQIDRAWQLFQESQEKGLIVSTDTYNSLITVADFLKEGYDLRWNFVTDMLSGMRNAQLKPNLQTLNAVLKILSTMGTSQVVKNNVLLTLAEFRALGIEPSLASWYYVLITYCKERGPTSPVLHDVMDHLDGKEFKIQDSKDTYFFVTAMDVCHHHLNDNNLARRVDNLLHTGNNYDLIGDSYKESIYYRHYVTLLCKTEPFDVFMEDVYHKLVPHIYVPEPSVMEEILHTVEATDSVQYLPKLWSDMVIFDHIGREKLINLVIDIMVLHQPSTGSDLIEKFSKIAWDIWSRYKEQKENENRTQRFSLSGEALGKILMLLLANKDFEMACVIMDSLSKNQQSILGVPSFEALSMFVDSSIELKVPSWAIHCIQYAADIGYEETSNLALKLNTSLTLDETHLSKLAKIVGPDVIQTGDKQT